MIMNDNDCVAMEVYDHTKAQKLCQKALDDVSGVKYAERHRAERYSAGMIAAELALGYAAGKNKKERSLVKALCYQQMAKDSCPDLAQVCPQIENIQECWLRGPNAQLSVWRGGKLVF